MEEVAVVEGGKGWRVREKEKGRGDKFGEGCG